MEPERPIEKLLRAWANRRRRDTEPPPNLHPATRRLLQGEVARKFGANQRQPRTSGWFARLWPRFAWALGMFAVLGIVVWLVVPPPADHSKRGWLAKGEPAATHEFSRGATPGGGGQSVQPADMFDQPGVARPQPTTAIDKKEFAEGQVRSEPQVGNRTDTTASLSLESLATETRKAERSANSAAPQVSAGGAGRASVPPASVSTAPMVAAGPAPSSAPSGPSSDSNSRRYGLSGKAATAPSSANSLAPIPPASPTLASANGSKGKDEVMKQASADADRSGAINKPLAAAAPSTSASSLHYQFYSDDGKVQKLTNGERFARVELQTKAKAVTSDKNTPAKAVLASFEVERIGREVRVVDGDGSVYTGYVQLPAEVAQSHAATEEKPAVSAGVRSRGVTLQRDALADAEAQGGKDYAFRVVGTNRTLKENVVFIGQLITANEVAVPSVTTNNLRITSYERKVASDAPKPAGSAATNASRISGKAAVGKRGEVEINAVSAGK